jgi:hypothetical protein
MGQRVEADGSITQVGVPLSDDEILAAFFDSGAVVFVEEVDDE